jgi:hypothetical protein
LSNLITYFGHEATHRPGSRLVADGRGCTSGARGQAVGTTTGIIDGVITDASGAVLPGAVVTASGDALMVSRSIESGPDGRCRLPNLPPGQAWQWFNVTDDQIQRGAPGTGVRHEAVRNNCEPVLSGG